MWQLWSHNLHQKDWGGISARIWKTLQGVYHHSERSTTASGDKFTYLGSTLSRVVHIDDEANARIAKACVAFGKLLGSIWDRSGIKAENLLIYGAATAERTFSSENGACKMDRPYYRKAWWTLAIENPLWRTTSGTTLPWWSEKAI